MQAGFAFLEIGFSRGKNAGTVVAKILTNFSIAALVCWAVGFAFAFGGGLAHRARTGFFLRRLRRPRRRQFPIDGHCRTRRVEAFFFFQFVFCAVSLAIVWGTTLERIKFGVYLIYAIVFAALIYPIVAHWIFGGGWLQVDVGMQDFAGSTVVHLIGATGAFAALLLLGPRKGKYGAGRQAAGDPGPLDAAVRPRRPDPVAGLVRVQPGLDARTRSTAASPRSCVVTQPRRRGRRARRHRHDLLQDEDARHRHGRQRRDRRARRDHRPVGLRRARGRRRSSASSPASSSCSACSRSTSTSTTRSARSPRTAWPASGARSRAACSPSPRLAEYNGVGDRRPGLHRLVHAARRPGARRGARRSRSCSSLSLATFWRDQGDATACASPRRRRTPAWTSPSTACTATRSSSSRRPSSSATVRGPSRAGAAGAGRLDQPRRCRHEDGRSAYIRHEAFEPIRTELLTSGSPR